jgi:hypothetical protein
MKILEELESKDKKIYIFAGIGILVVAATGFLLWRINQDEQLSSEESEAKETVVCGGQCVNDSDCIGWDDGDGNVECKQGVTPHVCQIYECPSGYEIGPSKCACIPSGGLACGEYGCAIDEDCAGGSDTDPDAEFECANRADGNVSKQQCVRMKCPTGYEIGEDKCSCVYSVANTCEGGGWTRSPSSFAEDESYTISGYGEDADGIDSSSIDVKIDGTSISSYKISKEADDTRTDWSTTLSGLSAGTHTVVVTWEDSEGEGGDDCTVSSTFTVTATEDTTEEDDTSETTQETEDTTDTTTTTPQTGLLDEAWGKIALGFTVLAMGMILMKFNVFEFNWTGVRVEGGNKIHKSSLKNNFEKKVVKRN